MIALMMRLFHVAEPEDMTSATAAAMVIIVAVALVWMVMFFGFLRSVFLDDQHGLMPGQLFGRGKPFFWRAVAFSFVVPMALLLLAQLLMIVLATAFGTERMWVAAMATGIALLVLVKIIVLSPAIMVVRDVPFLNSLAMTRRYRLKNQIGIIYAVLALIAVQVFHAWSRLGMRNNETDLFWTGLFAAAVQLILLTIMVMGVRFVGKADYARSPKPQPRRDRD